MLFFEVIFESRGYEYLKYMDMYPDISNDTLKLHVSYEGKGGDCLAIPPLLSFKNSSQLFEWC